MIAKIVQLSDDCSWFVENRRGDDNTILAGDKVRLTRGQLRMDFACGADGHDSFAGRTGSYLADENAGGVRHA